MTSSLHRHRTSAAPSPHHASTCCATHSSSEACGDGSLTLLIGPEGGLSKADAAHLEALGGTAASLGARILRAETAVVVGATLGLVALKERGSADLV